MLHSGDPDQVRQIVNAAAEVLLAGMLENEDLAQADKALVARVIIDGTAKRFELNHSTLSLALHHLTWNEELIGQVFLYHPDSALPVNLELAAPLDLHLSKVREMLAERATVLAAATTI
jgi:hypothetical protein